MLNLLIALPIAAAALTLLLPARAAKPFALVASLIPLGLTAYLMAQFNQTAPGFQFVQQATWLPALGSSWHVGLDGLSLLMVALTALLTPLCLLASWHEKRRTSAFFAAFLALEGAVIGLFASLDMLLFYLFWEAMLIPMFLLIGLWGGENRIYATLKFFLYTFVGSVLMLVAILYLWAHSGYSFEMDNFISIARLLPQDTQNWLWLAFFAAFAVKVPMWPFHTWLPDAHVQAPTAGSVILAGVLLKLGAYGFLRLNLPMLPLGTETFAPYVFTLSAIAVIYAALVAWVQTDIKKLIAYSSVSHMGLVTLGIFSQTEAGLHGAYLVMLNHGIVSAGLFLAVGVVYDRFHTRQLADYGGLVTIMPKYAFTVMLLTLAAVALPGTNSFVGEFLALAGSWPAAPTATAFATTGVIFGALYMLWLYRRMIFGTLSPFLQKYTSKTSSSSTLQPFNSSTWDMSLREILTFLPLLILIPLLGLTPHLAQNYIATPLKALEKPIAPTPKTPISQNPEIL